LIRYSNLFAGAVLWPALAALAACTAATSRAGSVPDPGPDTTARRGQTYVYECVQGGPFTVRVEGDAAWLFLASGTKRLPRMVSASGARFSDGLVSYWSKGDEATFVLDGRTYPACRNDRARAIWEDAKFRGVDFRAIGNEPGWHLEIFDNETVLFTRNNGQDHHQFSFVSPVSDSVSRTSSYDLQNAAHHLQITLEARNCSDSMSGESFETRVSLLFDGKAYSGCGRALH
jgi:putative lipoprotein